jgi:hypothetical protein
MLILIALKRLQHGVIVGGDWTRFDIRYPPGPESAKRMSNPMLHWHL